MSENQQSFRTEPLQGSLNYDCDGNTIRVAYNRFDPFLSPKNKQEAITSPDQRTAKKPAIIFIPGYSLTENASSLQLLCHQLADSSQVTTIAMDPYSKQVTPETVKHESEALRRYIEEHAIDNVTIIGNSQGGLQASALAALLQEKIQTSLFTVWFC